MMMTLLTMYYHYYHHQMIDCLHSYHVIVFFYNKYNVWMHSNEDVITFPSFDGYNINDITHCASPFTIYINSIVKSLTFGVIDSLFFKCCIQNNNCIIRTLKFALVFDAICSSASSLMKADWPCFQSTQTTTNCHASITNQFISSLPWK